jgi:hypothetical protein
LRCSTSPSPSSSEKGLVIVTRDAMVEDGMGDSSSGLVERRRGEAVVGDIEASTFFADVLWLRAPGRQDQICKHPQ